MSEKENFVFLASWTTTIESFDAMNQPELAGELAKQIIYYGTKGEMTTDNQMIRGIVEGMCVALIDQAKQKYQNCRINGNLGGRPEKYPVSEMARLRDAGLTNEEIAENMGCSAQTVSKKLKALDGVSDSDDDI